MLATQSISHAPVYMPTRSSPLTERSANACPRPFAFMSQSDNTKKPLPYSKRAIKHVPVPQNMNDVKDKRREMFLKKVKSGREDKNWEMRGDQILRMDFLKEQRQWQSEKARSALELEEDFMFDDADQVETSMQLESSEMDSSQRQPASSQQVQDYDEQLEAEAMLELEQAELEATLALMKDQENIATEAPSPRSSHFGSDDEEYDDLFMDYMATDSSQPMQAAKLQHRSDEMDMS